MGAEQTVSQREYDRFVKTTDEAIAQLRDDLKDLREERDDEVKSAKQVRIAAIAAGASVVAAWVGLFELWHSLGH